MGFTNSILRKHEKWHDLIGLEPPDDFESNGATLAPDILLGIDVRPAAHFHDYGYSGLSSVPHTEEERYWVDHQLLVNLKTCGLWGWVARAYYYRVRLWGHFQYQYDAGKEPRRTLRFWLHLFFGRFVQW